MERRLNGGFFALQVWGGLYLEGLTDGGANFRNFTVFFGVAHNTSYLPPKHFV